MTDWQPDWQALQTTAAPLIASDPLAAVITSVTPVGGYVAIALQATLSDVVSAATKAGPRSGPLVIAVDTLTIGPEDPVIAAPGVSIVARAVVVNGGPASLIVRSDTPQAGIQLTTAEISGSLNAAFQKADGSAMAGPRNGPLAMSGLAYPQVITVSAASAPAASTAQPNVADSLQAALPPTPQNSAATAQGAQYLAGSLASFGSAVALLWAVVAQVASSQPLNLSPDLASTVGKLPDLSGFSVGGLDPVTYWNAVVVQTTAAVKPYEDLAAATA